jgi:hypothetical protein
LTDFKVNDLIGIPFKLALPVVGMMQSGVFAAGEPIAWGLEPLIDDVEIYARVQSA